MHCKGEYLGNFARWIASLSTDALADFEILKDPEHVVIQCFLVPYMVRRRTIFGPEAKNMVRLDLKNWKYGTVGFGNIS